MFRNEEKLFRAFAIAGFTSLAAIVIGASLPAPLSGDHQSRIIHPTLQPDPYVQQAAYMAGEAAHTSYRNAPDRTCSSWDVSPAAMEEVLKQMIARGWTPPTRGVAVADLQMRGLQLQVVDPTAPMPARYQAPATLEDGPIPPVPLEQVELTPPAATPSPTRIGATEPAASPQSAPQ